MCGSLDKQRFSSLSLSSRGYLDLHSIQGGLATLLVASCWVPCDGLASHPGGVSILLCASCWVPCDGPASHQGGVSILLGASCWVPCDGLASHPKGVGGRQQQYCISSCFVLQKPELSAGSMSSFNLLGRTRTSSSPYYMQN